jgi:hypothetical protein
MNDKEKLKSLKTTLAGWDDATWEAWISKQIKHKTENVEIYKLQTLAKQWS